MRSGTVSMRQSRFRLYPLNLIRLSQSRASVYSSSSLPAIRLAEAAIIAMNIHKNLKKPIMLQSPFCFSCTYSIHPFCSEVQLQYNYSFDTFLLPLLQFFNINHFKICLSFVYICGATKSVANDTYFMKRHVQAFRPRRVVKMEKRHKSKK